MLQALDTIRDLLRTSFAFVLTSLYTLPSCCCVPQVTAESKFVDLGADSLDTVEIMMALEEKVGGRSCSGIPVTRRQSNKGLEEEVLPPRWHWM